MTQERPTTEQIAERAARANRATRGALAAVLCLEAVVVLLVPRAIAKVGDGPGTPTTIVLVGFAVALVVTGFLLRRPWAIGLGSMLQLPLFALGLLTAAFFALAAIFLAVWLWLLTIRRDLVGTPGGIRMLVS